MPFVQEEIIALILKGSPTQLYEMKRSETEFNVIFREIKYTPFDYGKSK